MYDLAEMNDPAFLSRVAELFQPAFMERMDAVGDAVESFVNKPSRTELLAMLGCDEQTFAAFLAVLAARAKTTGSPTGPTNALDMPSGPSAILHTDPVSGNVEMAFTWWPEAGRTLH